MSYFNDVLFGIIEGITEFLPISSTGHLLLAEHWLGRRSDMYLVVIQAGAILAVTLIYWRRLMDLAFGWREQANRDYLFKLTAAFLVTAILGLVVDRMGFELPEKITPIAWALVLGGFWMIFAESVAAKLPDSVTITWKVALAVGIAQVVAGIFPGLSRSGTTIFVAMLLGASNRAAATEFAFLVGIPTMYAASGYKLLESFSGDGAGAQAENWAGLGVAFVVSTVTAFVSVKWLLGYIRSNRFTAFAIYRIVFGAFLLGLVWAGYVQ